MSLVFKLDGAVESGDDFDSIAHKLGNFFPLVMLEYALRFCANDGRAPAAPPLMTSMERRSAFSSLGQLVGASNGAKSSCRYAAELRQGGDLAGAERVMGFANHEGVLIAIVSRAIEANPRNSPVVVVEDVEGRKVEVKNVVTLKCSCGSGKNRFVHRDGDQLRVCSACRDCRTDDNNEIIAHVFPPPDADTNTVETALDGRPWIIERVAWRLAMVQAAVNADKILKARGSKKAPMYPELVALARDQQCSAPSCRAKRHVDARPTYVRPFFKVSLLCSGHHRSKDQALTKEWTTFTFDVSSESWVPNGGGSTGGGGGGAGAGGGGGESSG